ncbi:MAG: transpeptidase family protein [Melioribacteraceae bacterium]|nr:transpeptidase family protein [Melioribacteraceae bacterium]
MNNSRALLSIFIFFVAFIAISVRLFNIQVRDHDKFKYYAERQQNRIYPIKAERGIIKDREGKVLAYTKDDISLFADTRMLTKFRRDTLASALSSVFGKSKNHYYKLFDSKKGNVLLEKKVSRVESLLLSDLVVDGFFKTEDYTRVYPYGKLASHVLGFVDQAENGATGIEKQFNDYLTGQDGRLLVERDALGRIVTVNDALTVPALTGAEVTLTISQQYQSILEEELEKGLNEYQSNSGVGIIMNPQNGEILAMASLPNYNPSSYSQFSNEERRNRILTDTYEPGSTIKGIVMAMLMDEGKVNPNEVINTENGSYKFLRTRIKDTHAFEKLTVQEVLEQSSNIGMVKLSTRIDDNAFYKYLRDFGFGNTTSIDIPGETGGRLKKPDEFSKYTKAFVSHGYEIAATPLQVITAFSAVINGGILYQPHVVKKVNSNVNNEVVQFDSKKIRKVISEKTSEKMKNLLIGVVENGTASLARLDDMLIGGKTGTSQKLINGSYSSSEYNSSFIGFFPADNPQVICLVVIDSPKIGRYGGRVAAPIFKNIAERIIESDINFSPYRKDIKRKNETNKDFLIAENLETENYVPKNEIFITANYSENSNEKEVENYSRTTMPSLYNKSIKESITRLTALGIKYKIKGSGKVIDQSIMPGTKLKEGMICELVCSSEMVN